MRREVKQALVVLLITLTMTGPVPVTYGRGGGGGGRGGGGGARMSGGGGGARMGGGGMGGGGMARPSPSIGRSPSMSRPAMPSRPSGGGGGRPGGISPGGGGAGLASRPGGGMTPGSRPGTVDFGRPGGGLGGGVAGLTPGTRPGGGTAGLTPGTRPGGGVAGLTPGTRPGIGTGPGLGQGPGISTLPAAPRPGIGTPGIGTPGIAGPGTRPGIGSGPGISTLPAGPGIQRPGGQLPGGQLPGGQLPGIATRPNLPGGGNTALLPGLGNRPGLGGERPSQLPGRTPQDRRADLQNRLADRGQINDRLRPDFGDRWDNVRPDWQNRYGNIYINHNHWHHGCWHGNAGGWWNHMWTQHTALMAFGTTMWGLNRAAWTFGYWGYANPFFVAPYPVGGTVINYSQPIVIESAPAATEQPADAPAPGMTEFDAARASFFQGDYAAALASTNQALAKLPNDPIIHEFRALVMFAQGKYQEAAAGLYSVLSVGPGWDWTTLSSLYPSVEVYTKQLRALENHVKQQPQATDARFVLAYHYLTMGSNDAAVSQLKQLHQKMPQDTLVKQLLLATGGPEALGVAAPAAEAPMPAAAAVAAADLVGNWGATGQGDTQFALGLTQDGNFTWTFTQGGKAQTVKGVYALDGDTLAMEPETGGTMLATVTPPQGGKFRFQLLGAPPGDPGLNFAKKG